MDSCHIVKVSMHQTGIFLGNNMNNNEVLREKIPQSELITNNLHSGRNDALSIYSLTLSFVHNTRENVQRTSKHREVGIERVIRHLIQCFLESLIDFSRKSFHFIGINIYT